MIFRAKYFFLYASALCFFISCENSKEVVEEKKVKNADTAISSSSGEAASNAAIIVANIVFIDETRDSSDIYGPCYKAPCLAKIKIEKIIKKGSLFHLKNTDEIITVYFEYTLFPTSEDLFPNLDIYLPGLKINDKFEATIQSRLALNEGVRYIIYDYKKME